MTPLDIMEALRDVPEDLIDIDYEDLFASRTADSAPLRTETSQPDTESLPEPITVCRESDAAEQTGTGVPENGKRMRGSIVLSYLMTACCTAACIGGIAVLICMTKLSSNYSVQPQDTGITQLQPTVTVTAAAACPNTATTASELYTGLLSGIQNTAQALTAAPMPYPEQTAVPVSTTCPVSQTTAPPAATASTTVTAAHTTASVTEKMPELL